MDLILINSKPLIARCIHLLSHTISMGKLNSISEIVLE